MNPRHFRPDLTRKIFFEMAVPNGLVTVTGPSVQTWEPSRKSACAFDQEGRRDTVEGDADDLVGLASLEVLADDPDDLPRAGLSVTAEFGFDIVSGEGEPLEGEPVMQSLQGLLSYTGCVVSRFDRFFD
jgi:hypothetical protein